jgi:hypothetical protein
LVSCRITTRRHNPEDIDLIFITVKTWNLAWDLLLDTFPSSWSASVIPLPPFIARGYKHRRTTNLQNGKQKLQLLYNTDLSRSPILVQWLRDLETSCNDVLSITRLQFMGFVDRVISGVTLKHSGTLICTIPTASVFKYCFIIIIIETWNNELCICDNQADD